MVVLFRLLCRLFSTEFRRFVAASSALAVLSLCSLAEFPCQAAFAADISVRLSVTAKDDAVEVVVENTGRDMAELSDLTISLAGREYRKSLGEKLAAGKVLSREFLVQLPDKPGSYPLLTTLQYLNDGVSLSVVDAGYFNFQRADKEELRVSCGIDNIHLAETKVLRIPRDNRSRFRLFLPEEIEQQPLIDSLGPGAIRLRNLRPQFSSNYQAFGIFQSPRSWSVQQTKICGFRLITSKTFSRKSWFSSVLLAFILIGSLVTSLFLYRRSHFSPSTGGYQKALIRHFFSIFVVSGLYLLYRDLRLLSDWILPWLYSMRAEGELLSYLKSSVEIVLRALYFEGRDYDYFFRYLADPLYLYMLSVNLLVLRYLVRPGAEDDKYWQLMVWAYSLFPLRYLSGELGRQRGGFTRKAKIAILSLLVKAFYLPLLASWAVSQAFYLLGLRQGMDFDFYSINMFLVNSLLLIDVTIFLFGYLTELPQLGNRIRSVEPTVLGWLVCIVCYPPFNSFAFVLIDKPLHEYWTPSDGVTQKVALALITFLWGVYVWASVALGAKASNLTNRGIVSSGPYRLIRHPAYVAKVSLWIISSYFIAQFNFFLVCGFVLVYSLRAWTEERHLSQDPDYLTYKRQVPWKIIPYVF